MIAREGELPVLRALRTNCLAWAISVVASPVAHAQAPDPAKATYPQPFVGFIENHGQWSTDVRFLANFDGVIARAEPGAIVLQTMVEEAGRSRVGVVRLAFDSCHAVEPFAGQQAPGEFHFLLGNDPQDWHRHVPSFDDVRYSDAWPGIDVRLHQVLNHLEYDIIVSAGADERDAIVRCDGIDGITIGADGALWLNTPLGPIRQAPPISRQVTFNGEIVQASCRYRVVDSRHFGFEVTDRLVGAALVIDPGLTWATFLGGSSGDWTERVRVLDSGKLLVVGASESLDFPVTPGVFDSTLGGPTASDATVTVLSANGDAVVFSTYLGGLLNEQAYACDVAGDGSIAIGGFTESSDFPTTEAAFDRTMNGSNDAFVALLSADGSDLSFSTYFGGTGACLERVRGLGITSAGVIVAAGLTCNFATDFPVTPQAFDTTLGGSSEGFVSWLDPSLSGPAQLICSTLLGGSMSDQIRDLTMSPGDEPVVVGETTSSDFPTTPNAFQGSIAGGFVTRLAEDGTSLIASTIVPAAFPLAVVADRGTILISGTATAALPVTPNAYDTTWNGSHDAFVSRLDGQLSRLLASTYVGGSEFDSAAGLATDRTGRIVFVGSTSSADFPVTPGAFDAVHEGGLSTSVVGCLTADLSALDYASFLGPSWQVASGANDVAVLEGADVVVVGDGAFSGFPVTTGAFDETFNGGSIVAGDAYVARMVLAPLTWTTFGGALSGSNGAPLLTGTGSLVGGQPLTLSLNSAKPATPIVLVVGSTLLNAPFKGGALVPNPSLLLFGLQTNGHGTLVLNATWPSGLPSGLVFVTQFWIPDAVGPAGFAASNGLAGVTP